MDLSSSLPSFSLHILQFLPHLRQLPTESHLDASLPPRPLNIFIHLLHQQHTLLLQLVHHPNYLPTLLLLLLTHDTFLGLHLRLILDDLLFEQVQLILPLLLYPLKIFFLA